MQELFDLIDKFNENHRAARVKYAVFAMPIINDTIYLAQRNTPPHVDLYSLIGGKVEQSDEDNPKIELPRTQGSLDLEIKGFEGLKWAGLRELIEELYNQGVKLTTEDIRSLDLTKFSIYDHVTLLDANTGVKCYTKIIILPSEFSLSGRRNKSNEFNLSVREIGDIQRAYLINPGLMNPLTKVALSEMRHDDRISRYSRQIPEIKHETKKGFVGWFGDSYRSHADYKSRLSQFQGIYFDYEITSV